MLKYVHHIVRPAMKETSLNAESSKKDTEKTHPIRIVGLRKAVHDLMTLPGGFLRLCMSGLGGYTKKVIEEGKE